MTDRLLDYTIAKGPEGLREVLEALWLKSLDENAPEDNKEHILYLLNNQKSLLTVDTHQKPFQFYYYDLLSRPATKSIKEVIGNFLLEKFGVIEKVLQIAEGEKL